MGLKDEDNQDILAKEERKRKRKEKRKLKEAKIQGMNVDEIEEEDEIKLRVEILGEQPDKISPVVCYFPSGLDPLKNKQLPEVRVFRNTKRTQRSQLVVSPIESKVDFVGNSHSTDVTPGVLCNYALGVLDKATGTLKIVPIASNKLYYCLQNGKIINIGCLWPIFSLEPKIDGLVESDIFPTEEKLTEDKKVEIKKENGYSCMKQRRQYPRPRKQMLYTERKMQVLRRI